MPTRSCVLALESHHFLYPALRVTWTPVGLPLTSPAESCKVLPAGPAAALCWHRARSAQDFTSCWLRPVLFVFGLKKIFIYIYIFTSRGMGFREEEENAGQEY